MAGKGMHKESIVPCHNYDFVEKRYRKEKCLGEGAFGKVYLLTDKHTLTSTRVAKYVQVEGEDWDDLTKSEKAESWDDAKNELKLLSELDHPNIVKVFEVGLVEKEATLIMVMESCYGGDMECLVEKARKRERAVESTAVMSEALVAGLVSGLI